MIDIRCNNCIGVCGILEGNTIGSIFAGITGGLICFRFLFLSVQWTGCYVSVVFLYYSRRLSIGRCLW
ncbi:hypothetical protein BJX99DRAFT_105369 [Aspergillus californicus]